MNQQLRKRIKQRVISTDEILSPAHTIYKSICTTYKALIPLSFSDVLKIGKITKSKK